MLYKKYIIKMEDAMSRLGKILFGWEEVLVTPSLEVYLKQKSELENNGIRTDSEFINNPRAGSLGTFGSSSNVCLYYLYVKKRKK